MITGCIRDINYYYGFKYNLQALIFCFVNYLLVSFAVAPLNENNPFWTDAPALLVITSHLWQHLLLIDLRVPLWIQAAVVR